MRIFCCAVSWVWYYGLVYRLLPLLLVSCAPSRLPCAPPDLPTWQVTISTACHDTAREGSVDALEAWNRALGRDVFSVVGEHRLPIRCHGPEYPAGYCAPGMWAGWWEGFRQAGGTIHICHEKPVDRAAAAAIVAHELGHVLGLGHTACGTMSTPHRPCGRERGAHITCADLEQIK